MTYIMYMAYILKKRIKGRTYYYLAESQRIDGNPRIVWQKYLGNADKIKEKLLESKKEYIEDISTFEIGSLAAIESIEREINFLKIVDEIVPKRNQGMSVGLYLYLIVLNRAIEPKSKASLGEWLKKTAISEYREVDFSLLDSANFWDHMDKVSQEQIEAISDEVSKRVIERYDISLDCLLYDTTNYFTQMSARQNLSLAATLIPRPANTSCGMWAWLFYATGKKVYLFSTASILPILMTPSFFPRFNRSCFDCFCP